MNESQSNIAQATNGLVWTLYLASVLFLALMLYLVLQDINDRRSGNSLENEAQQTKQSAVSAPPSLGSPDPHCIHPLA